VRIATWNLERLKLGESTAAHYDEVLQSFFGDLLVVTEPGPGFVERHPDAVLSPRQRTGSTAPESWIALLGSSIQMHRIQLPYNRLAAAGWAEIRGRQVALYGSILPWNHHALRQAPDVYGSETRTFTEIFDQALKDQVEDIVVLQREFGSRNVFWAGDFNHPLAGSLRGYVRYASVAISNALAQLGMTAFNADAPNAHEGAKAIDLVCGPSELVAEVVQCTYPILKGRPMSDHRGYCVSVEWPQGSSTGQDV
jgi:hypothetical protein